MKIIDKFVSLIYPRRCISCNEILKGEHKWICKSCRNDFVSQGHKRCRICGRIIYHNGKCRACNSNKRHFDKGYSVFEYKSAVRRGIINFKYKKLRSYGNCLGDFMSRYALDNISMDYDYITAVPLHSSRLKARGYNQSEILAKAVSRKTGVQYKPILERQVNTRPLNSLGSEERYKEIKGAFSLRKGISVEGKSILIIDDIYTTGTTINECCKVLKRNKAEVTDFFTLSCRSED